MKPRLSLIIPTFKRNEELSCVLENIITLHAQAPQLAVEVIISDNDPSNNFFELKNKNYTRKKNFSIKYFQNSSNLGMDTNFLNALDKARGDYLIFLSDRYLYHYDFAKIEAILNEQPDVVMFSDRLRPFHAISGTVSANNDRWLLDIGLCEAITPSYSRIIDRNRLENFLMRGAINAFSEVIFSKGSCAKALQNIEKYVDTYMLGVAIQLRTVAMANTILVKMQHSNVVTHQHVGITNAETRHNYEKVVSGNRLLQQEFAFLGSKRAVLTSQLIGLVRLRIKITAQTYKSLHPISSKMLVALAREINLSKLPIFVIIELLFAIFNPSARLARTWISLRHMIMIHRSHTLTRNNIVTR